MLGIQSLFEPGSRHFLEEKNAARTRDRSCDRPAA
jgi:hypothetical protein